VTNITPQQDANYTVDDVINITANVTDNVALDTVLANITWDSKNELLVMTDNDGDDVFNASFTNTTFVGRYNVTITANDTMGNVNSTESTYFNIRDITPPTITNVNATGVDNTSALIVWDTDENANSSVNYGETLSLGNYSNDSSYVT